jgi:hypothetical protein
MSDWYMMIPLMVFTKLKQNFSQTIKNKYNMTDKNFSTVGSSDTPAVFPFVYFNTLPASETGSTFETGINSGIFGFQIDVYSNKTQSEVRTIAKEISRVMVAMGLREKGFGSFEDTKDLHRMTLRFQRTIGADDKL